MMSRAFLSEGAGAAAGQQDGGGTGGEGEAEEGGLSSRRLPRR